LSINNGSNTRGPRSIIIIIKSPYNGYTAKYDFSPCRRLVSQAIANAGDEAKVFIAKVIGTK
jgi:hypothetical protein